MNPRLLACSALLLGVSPIGAAGQALTGRVFDGVTGRAVAGVEVAVLTDSGGPAGLAVTDSVGAFHTPLAGAGDYRLVATAVGYDSLVVDSIRIGESEDVWVELRLGPRPFDVDGLTVVARRPMGPPPLREFYRRLERHRRYGGGGLVLDRDALDRHIAQTGATVLARESIHVREVTGLGGGLIVKRRAARFGQSRWCTPAFFLDGNRVDGQTIRSIPAADLLGLELYRGIGQVPAQFMVPGATGCGVVLAWSRRGGRPGSAGATRPLAVGAWIAGITNETSGGELDFGGIGLELEKGLARLLVGWVELGLTQAESDPICVPEPGATCPDNNGVPWIVVAGASLFPFGSAIVAPYVGGGIGAASPGTELEIVQLWRAGLELGPAPFRVRVEVRGRKGGWGGAAALMYTF